MNRSSCAMNATAASTAMIHQRAGCPLSDDSAETSRPPVAALAVPAGVIAIALLIVCHGRPVRLRCKQSPGSVRHPDFDLGSLSEPPSKLSTATIVRSMNLTCYRDDHDAAQGVRRRAVLAGASARGGGGAVDAADRPRRLLRRAA